MIHEQGGRKDHTGPLLPDPRHLPRRNPYPTLTPMKHKIAPDGNYYAPWSGLYVTVRNGTMYWQNGDITPPINNPLLSPTIFALEDYSKWTDEQRALAKEKWENNRKEAQAEQARSIALARSAAAKLTDDEWNEIIDREFGPRTEYL